jgi:predicted aconitase with swiveling domain
MERTRFSGEVMVAGLAKGEALVSRQAFTFAHGVDPKSGLVTDPRSDIRGMLVKRKILIFPFGKGSTTGATWFLETVRRGNGPLAILNQRTEPIIVTGSVLARILYHKNIPVMSQFGENLPELIGTGERVLVDTPRKLVEIRR